MVSAAGWRVEKVIRTFPDELPVARLRVSWRGYWQADCLTTTEVAGYVDLSSLVPATPHLYGRVDPPASRPLARDVLDDLLRKAIEDAGRPTDERRRRHLWVVRDDSTRRSEPVVER